MNKHIILMTLLCVGNNLKSAAADVPDETIINHLTESRDEGRSRGIQFINNIIAGAEADKLFINPFVGSLFGQINAVFINAYNDEAFRGAKERYAEVESKLLESRQNDQSTMVALVLKRTTFKKGLPLVRRYEKLLRTCESTEGLTPATKAAVARLLDEASRKINPDLSNKRMIESLTEAIVLARLFEIQRGVNRDTFILSHDTIWDIFQKIAYALKD